MKNILLIATGGTIASKDNGNGLTPLIDVNVLLDYIPVIRQKCHVTGISLMNIDSSNMDTSHISSISECIMNNYNDYDGFVITHGTDTCAYTAAALSYQLINLSKPVILTGSQLPIDVEKTDAVMNLTNAFIYSCEDISGVFLAFSEKLIKGTCAKKIKTKSFDAFESINFPYIAAIRNNIVKYSILQLVIPFKRRQHGCVQTQTVNQYTVYRIRELIQVKLTIKKFDLFEIYMRMFPVQKHHPITQMP